MSAADDTATGRSRLNISHQMARFHGDVTCAVVGVKMATRDKFVVKCIRSWSVRFYWVRARFGDRGGTVVKVLCYKSEGHWFDPSWCPGFFIDIKSFRLHYGPGVYSASNRNEYQEYFLGVKATGA